MIPMSLKKGAYSAIARLSKSITPRANRVEDGLRNVVTIGMCTYVKRYDKYFTKVLPQLAAYFPDVPIVVIANGYYDASVQASYLERIRQFASKYNNVQLKQHSAPRGLASIWNEIIDSSETDNVFILNDDIACLPGLRSQLLNIAQQNVGVTLFNASWSHFVINKRLIRSVGKFDPDFPGVGNEDQDYEIRMALCGAAPHVVRSLHVKNFNEVTKDFSYGRDIVVANHKYSGANYDRFRSKYDIRDTWAPGYVYVRIMGAYCRAI